MTMLTALREKLKEQLGSKPKVTKIPSGFRFSWYDDEIDFSEQITYTLGAAWVVKEVVKEWND